MRACCGLVRHFYDGVPRRQGRERNTDHACLISCQYYCTKSSYNDLNFVQKHRDHPLYIRHVTRIRLHQKNCLAAHDMSSGWLCPRMEVMQNPDRWLTLVERAEHGLTGWKLSMCHECAELLEILEGFMEPACHQI